MLLVQSHLPVLRVPANVPVLRYRTRRRFRLIFKHHIHRFFHVPVAFGAPTFIRRRNVRFVWIVNSRRWWHSAIKSRFRALITKSARRASTKDMCARFIYVVVFVVDLFFFVIEKNAFSTCSTKASLALSHLQQKRKELCLFLVFIHKKNRCHKSREKIKSTDSKASIRSTIYTRSVFERRHFHHHLHHSLFRVFFAVHNEEGVNKKK